MKIGRNTVHNGLVACLLGDGGKVDPWSGPGLKERMHIVLSTRVHGTLMPSPLEDNTYLTMSFLTKMPVITARMEVQAALNYPTFYITGAAVTCLALGNSLPKEGYADFTLPLSLGWCWAFWKAGSFISTKLPSPNTSLRKSVGQETKFCPS